MKLLLETIECKGTPSDEWRSEAWPNDDVRRETAVHVLQNHFDHISGFERTVCEKFTSPGSHITDGAFATMDVLVNTYHHEL